MNRMQTALLDIIRITLAHTGTNDINVGEIITRKTQHFGHEFPLNETGSEGCVYATTERTAA